jgi:hypothetical protein
MGEISEPTGIKKQPVEGEQGDFERGEGEVRESRESEADGQKEKETETSAFRQTIEKETRKIVSAVQSLQDLLDKFGTPPEEAAPDTTGLSADQLKKLYDGSHEQVGGMKTANQILGSEIPDRLAKLDALKIDAAQGADELSATVQEIAGLLSTVQTNSVQAFRLEKEAQDVYESYKSVRVQEAGYDSMKSLEDGYWEKFDRIRDLRRPFFGRWRNKIAIRDLEDEIKKLEEVKNLSYNDPYVSGWNFADTNGIKQLMEAAAEKSSRYYEELLLANPEPQDGKDQGALLSSEELDGLNDQYIRENVLPRVEKEKDSCRSLIDRGYREYREQLAELEDPENIAKLLALVKRSYSESYSSPWDEKWQDFRQQIEILPQRLRGFIVTGNEPANKRFEELASFVSKEGSGSKQAIIKTAYRDVLKSLESTFETSQKKSNLYLGSLPYDLSSRLRNLEKPESGFRMEQFLLDFDMDRWEAFKTNPQMIAHFGRERLEDADRQIGQGIKERILQLPDHTDECIKLGYKLYHFKEAEYVPLAILNAHREAGYSGERPFLSSGILHNYLTSLDPKEIEKLNAMNIPGCNEALDLILSNPENFNWPSMQNQTTEKWEDNPVYNQIQQNLGKMAVHFLQQGGHKMDFYLMGLLDYLPTELGEGNEMITQILVRTTDQRSRSAALECAMIRIGQGDTGTVAALIGVYEDLPEDVRQRLLEKAGGLIQGLAKHEVLDEKIVAGFSHMLGRPADEMNSLLGFLRLLQQDQLFYQDISENDLPKFFEAANTPAVTEFYKRFRKLGYDFVVDHMDFLPELIAEQETLAGNIAEIKQIFPEFRYAIDYDMKWNAEKGESDKIYHPNPFDCLMRQKQPEELLSGMAEILKREGSFHHEFSDGLMRSLRKSDILLQQEEAALLEPSRETYDLFHDGLQEIIRESRTSTGKLREYADFFENKHLLQFAARQPERIPELMKLPESVPQLFALLQPGGPLYTNRESVLRTIFENGDAVRRAREISAIFTERVPYWRQLYLFTESRIGDNLAAATSAYPITEIAGVPLSNIVRRHIQAKNENPASLTTLESMIADPAAIERLVSGNADSVPLNCFAGMYKKLIFRDYLRRTIETSRSEQAKAAANARNRLLAADLFAAVPDSYIHGSSIDFIDSVMLNGNLPQEALGESAGTDSYPFQVDFTKLKDDYLAQQKSVPEIFDNSISRSYGSRGSLGQNGQLFYIYDRSKADWEPGKDYATSPDGPHALILGGMPSTEVTGIVLRNADASLSKARQSILENGCYIPIYDIEGKLLMDPDEYDLIRRENNLAVPVEIWDNSLKTGDQQGSNTGGEFTVPEKGGPAKYYVKFGKDASNDHLWNEQLADNLYRVADLDVPDTKVVRVEGSFGHASRLIDGHEPGSEEYRALLKPGFIMDCWLGNWDIAAKSDNAKVDAQSGRLNRIDNGGALLFRARGDRKPNFGGAVIELETMRGSYPGLTPDEISEQIANLREVFTDEVIDRQVDGVRLSQRDRDLLKVTLRDRRDYIISYFENAADADAEQLTDEGKEIPQLLQAAEINDGRLAVLIPEWDKLIGEAGYQHNGALLGSHIKEAITNLRRLPEFQQLDSKERDLATVAALFHDIAKPTGGRLERVVRDFDHEIPSAQLAANYMQKWGYSRNDIRTVAQAILYDGVVSDIARGKVRDQAKNLSPEQLRSQLNDSRAVRILRALNHADVVATAGAEAYSAIEQAYNEYFEKV